MQIVPGIDVMEEYVLNEKDLERPLESIPASIKTDIATIHDNKETIAHENASKKTSENSNLIVTNITRFLAAHIKKIHSELPWTFSYHSSSVRTHRPTIEKRTRIHRIHRKIQDMNRYF